MAGRVAKAMEFFGLRQPPHQVGKPIPTTRRMGSRASLVDGDVLTLPIVRRCIGEINNLIGACKPIVLNRKKEIASQGWDEMPTWLQYPNPLFTGPEMLDQMGWSLYLQGETYLTWNRTPRGNPTDLWVPRAEDISTYWAGDYIVYTDWLSGDTKTAEFIAHRRLMAAPEVMRGIGVARTGRTLTGVATDAADALSNHILRDAILGIVFSFKKKLGDTQRKQFLAMLEENMAGPENAGSPLVMEEEGKAERIAPSMADEKLMELNRDLNARIASEVFFLNPRTFDLGADETGLTYRNASQLDYQNWRSAAFRPAQRIASIFSAMMPGTFYLDPNDNLRGPPEQRSQLIANMALANERMHKINQPIPFSAEDIREVQGHHGPPVDRIEGKAKPAPQLPPPVPGNAPEEMPPPEGEPQVGSPS